MSATVRTLVLALIAATLAVPSVADAKHKRHTSVAKAVRSCL